MSSDTMRRLSKITAIIVLSFLVSGLGIAFAALCPHAGNKPALVMAEDHACCRVKFVENDHQSAAGHEAMADMPMTTTVAVQANVETDTLGQPSEPCVHCMGSSETPLPSSITRRSNQTGRDANWDKPDAVTPLSALTASFAPPVQAKQGAPPGASTPRHLLISVFLI